VPSLRVLSATEVRRLINADELRAALVEGFCALTAGTAVAPGRSRLDVPGAGFLLDMPAWLAGHPMTVKLVSVFEGNPAHGLPRHQAVINVFDSATGTPLGLLDATWITAARTAGAAALATECLARADARLLVIIGSGVQGAAHLDYVARTRQFDEILVVGRDSAGAEQLAARDPRARCARDVESAVRSADVLCLCTNSPTPVIDAGWVRPATFVTSVGFAPPGSEVPAALVRDAQLVVETRAAFAQPPVGCAELQGYSAKEAVELGEVLRDGPPTCVARERITLYKSMGHAVEDLVVAARVFARAVATDCGTLVDL
jgi:alanine dehydrogenase